MAVELSALAAAIKIGNVSGAQFFQINPDGTIENITGNTSYTVTGSEPVGSFYWDSDLGTFAIKLATNVIQGVGEEIYLPKVLNNTGATIANGKLVRISGASGQKPTIAVVDGTSAVIAHETIAMATEEILDTAFGRVTTFGVVRGLNTNAYADGAQLYLDPTSAVGEFTDTEPTGSQAYVKIGRVIKSHVSDGWIFIDIEHVPQMDELANVNLTSVANCDRLVYNSTTGTWVNEACKYGEIYATANAAPLTLTVQNTWYQVTAFNNDGLSNGMTVSNTEDHIVAPDTGIYKVHLGVSFSGTGNQTYELEIKKNNGTTSFVNVHIERKIGTGGDIGAAGTSGLLSLTASDTVELWARCTSAAGADITIKDCNMWLEKIK